MKEKSFDLEQVFETLKAKVKGKSTFTPSILVNSHGIRYVKDALPLFETFMKEKKIEWLGGKTYSFCKNKAVTNPISKGTKSSEQGKSIDDYSEDVAEHRLKKYSNFVATTAVVNRKVNYKYFKSLLNYAERNNAAIVVFPCGGRTGKRTPDTLDSLLNNERVIILEHPFNVYNDLYLGAFNTTPRQANSSTGLDSVATRLKTSIISPGTRVSMHYVPTMKGNLPYAVMTTGCITENVYGDSNVLKRKIDCVASANHKFSAIAIDLDKDCFHFRQLEASKDNCVTDLGIEYHPDGTIKVLTDTYLILGDSHVAVLDSKLHDVILKSFIPKLGIKHVVLHDLFDSCSITHHDKNKNVTRAIKASNDQISVNKEGKKIVKYLSDFRDAKVDVSVVSSNHDRHLDRYLEEGEYIKDPINYEVGHKLALAKHKGLNVFQYLVEKVLGYSDRHVKWLKQDESYVVYGVELGIHGSEGSNGAKGSIKTFEKCVGNCITAHTHSARIEQDAMCVGTVAKLEQGYNVGLSNWTRTVALCYSNGTKQLINFIPNKKGEYKWSIEK